MDDANIVLAFPMILKEPCRMVRNGKPMEIYIPMQGSAWTGSAILAGCAVCL